MIPSARPRPAALRLLVAALLLPLPGCGGGGGEPARTEVVVSAAASLRDVMTELAERYQAEHPEVAVRSNFAGSGTLAQQIRQGAGVDLIVSASDRPLEPLERAGLIEPASRRVLASNELVLVVPAGRGGGVRELRDLASPAVERVALGAPSSVPAGEYAREALEAEGVWGAVEPKAVFAANVRQVLTYVERGEVDAGLVYRTDALGSDRVRVVATVAGGPHRPIAYPAALVRRSERPEAARRYLDYLAGADARAVWVEHGFRAEGRAGGGI